MIGISYGDNYTLGVPATTFIQPNTSMANNSGSSNPIFTLLTPQNSNPMSQPAPRSENIPEKIISSTKIGNPTSIIPNQTTSPTFINPPYLTLSLTPGWNFISVPNILLPGNDTAAIFSRVDTRGHSMYRYDPISGWIKVRISDFVTPMEGFWIYSAFPANIPLYSRDDLTEVSSSRTLQSGWNTLGISGITPQTINQTLNSIPDKWLFLVPFNSTTQMNGNPLIKGWNGTYGDRYQLEPGKGYWIYMTSGGALTSEMAAKDIAFSGTVGYKVSEQGWTITLPGTITGSLSPETGKLQIFSSDAVIKYAGKSYPISMDINANVKK